MSTRGTKNTSISEFFPNASSANVTGTTHNHIGQDSHSTTTNNYTQCSRIYNYCTVNFNDTSRTTSCQTGAVNDSDEINETVERPMVQNSASSDSWKAVWAILVLCILTGGRWSFDIMRHIVRRQLFAPLNRVLPPVLEGLDDTVAEAVRVEVEGSGDIDG
ncbi:hypothetical protein V5O48_013835 [Marasmius crinis-equi]|uniref:Uncharacterized protein n=1 Tax=Marasmius crinis-equi TaxID=585013 RepID=A0ABR3EZ46_9AGAR